MYRGTIKRIFATYHLILTASVPTEFIHVLVYIGNNTTGIQSQLGLGTE